MGSGARRCKDEPTFIFCINKQLVGCDMALAESFVSSDERMVAMPFGKLFTLSESIDHVMQRIHVCTALLHPLGIFTEPRSSYDRQHRGPSQAQISKKRIC